MSALYVVALAALAERDAAFISSFRQQHDARQAALIAPHFTLVFGCDGVPLPQFLAHVDTVTRGLSPINFCCRRATAGTDAQGKTSHVFLVPHEGADDIAQLHDKLYTGPLAPYLRADLPFTPHITVGSVLSHEQAQTLCDELNAAGIEIHGMFDAIAVGSLHNDKFTIHKKIRLIAGNGDTP